MQRLNQKAFIKNLMYTECWTCLLMSTMLSVLKEFETLCRKQTDRWVVMIQKPIYPWRVKTLDRVQRIIAQRGWEFIEILFKQKQCLVMGEDLQAELGIIDPTLPVSWSQHHQEARSPTEVMQSYSVANLSRLLSHGPPFLLCSLAF